MSNCKHCNINSIDLIRLRNSVRRLKLRQTKEYQLQKVTVLKEIIKIQKDILDKAEEVIEFYGKKFNYINSQDLQYHSDISRDNGNKARKWLEKWTEEN